MDDELWMFIEAVLRDQAVVRGVSFRTADLYGRECILWRAGVCSEPRVTTADVSVDVRSALFWRRFGENLPLFQRVATTCACADCLNPQHLDVEVMTDGLYVRFVGDTKQTRIPVRAWWPAAFADRYYLEVVTR